MPSTPVISGRGFQRRKHPTTRPQHICARCISHPQLMWGVGCQGQCITVFNSFCGHVEASCPRAVPMRGSSNIHQSIIQAKVAKICIGGHSDSVRLWKWSGEVRSHMASSNGGRAPEHLKPRHACDVLNTSAFVQSSPSKWLVTKR